MNQINATALLTAATEEKASPQSPWSTHALPAKRDPSGIAVEQDVECDLAIPMRVFSNWTPSYGAREIVRPLTGRERALLTSRSMALAEALRPYSPDQRQMVIAEIAAALSGYLRNMRMSGEDAINMAEIAARALDDLPAWAIAMGCSIITRKTPLDPHWAPSNAEIHNLIEERILKRYRNAKLSADMLLAAQVEQRDSPYATKLSHEEIEAKLGRKIGDPIREMKSRIPPPGDGKHIERIAADLDARRARNEASSSQEVDAS